MTDKLLFFSVLLAFTGLVGGQTVPESEPKTASLRGWAVGDGDSVTLALEQSPNQAPLLLATAQAGPPTSGGGYREVPAGHQTITLANGRKVLSTKRVQLEAKHSYTALAWLENGKWKLETFVDAPPKKQASSSALRVLNFAAGRPTMLSEAAGADKELPPDSVFVSEMPRKLTTLVFKVLDPGGGAPAQSSVEIDFAALAAAYVVIAPDYRGRMRPRVITGGIPSE